MFKTVRRRATFIGILTLGFIAAMGAMAAAQTAQEFNTKQVVQQLIATIENLREAVKESDSRIAEIDSAIANLKDSGLSESSEPVKILMKSRDDMIMTNAGSLEIAKALAVWMEMPLDGTELSAIFENALQRLRMVSTRYDMLTQKIGEFDRALKALETAGIKDGEPLLLLTQQRREYAGQNQILIDSLKKLVTPIDSGPAGPEPGLEATLPAAPQPPVTVEPADSKDRAQAAEKLFKEGEALFESGDFARAISKFDEVILIFPNFAPAYFSRGLSFANTGRYDQAIANFETAVKLAPDDMPEAYFNLGVAFFGVKEFDQAIANFNRAIELDPNFAEAYNGHGAVYASMGKVEEAVSDFTYAIAVNPNLAEAYYNRALSYNSLGNKKAASADLKAYLKFGDVQFKADAEKLLKSLR